jgi:hypothetical protein
MRNFTTNSLTVQLSNTGDGVRLQDGRWLVQEQSPGVGVQVLNVTTTEGNAGSVINSPGKGAADVQRLSAIGQVMRPGDVLLAASTAGGGNQCDEMTAVHVVPAVDFQGRPWVPEPSDIAGPCLGRSGPAVDFLRGVEPIRGSRVDAARLPSVVDIEALGINWSAWGRGRPTFEWLESKFAFIGDVGDMWGTTGSPVSQVEPYGRQFACRVSVALVMLCSTAPAEHKQRLAVRLVQAGVDLLGAFLDGREQEVDGGWYQGRKALVLFALHMLDVPRFLWPLVLRGQFQEDLAYGDVGPWQWGNPQWRYGWRGRHRNRHFWHLPPAQWNEEFRERWYANSYLYANTGPQVGTALAMRLLGLTQYMSPAMDGWIAQWMQGPSPTVVQDLAAQGVSLPWGEDWSTDRAGGFCAAAWRLYAGGR